VACHTAGARDGAGSGYDHGRLAAPFAFLVSGHRSGVTGPTRPRRNSTAGTDPAPLANRPRGAAIDTGCCPPLNERTAMKSPSLLLALALVLPTAALADARIQFQATEGGGADLQSLQIGHGKMRSDVDGNISVILDPGAGTMTMVDHGQRSFTRLTRADIEKLGGAVNAAMAQMEQALANLPPEMRSQVQGMVGGSLPGMGGMPSVQVVETGQRGNVAGHACSVYQTRMDGKAINESCMGSLSALDALSSADRNVLDGAFTMMQELAEGLAQGPMAQMIDLSTFQSGMIPLRMTNIENGRRASSEFSGIDTSALPADNFAVPAGYREEKLEMPDLSALGR